METEDAEITDSPEMLAFIGGADPLRRVLYDIKPVFLRYLHNRVHFTPDTGVVDGHYRLSALCHGITDQALINVHRIRPYIYEYELGPPQIKCVCGGYKSVRRQDNFVPVAHPAEDSGHFKRGCTRSGQEDLTRVKPFLQERMAFFCKQAVAGDMSAADRLPDIIDLFPDDKRFVKRYLHDIFAGLCPDFE